MMAVALAATTACNNDNYIEPTKNWDDSTKYFASTEVAAFGTYFAPSVGYVGDPMPMYDSKTGEYKIYYLWDYRGKRNYDECYHPIHMVTTKDGYNFGDEMEVLPTGGQKDQDAAIGTGCVVERNGVYYCYYTGHAGDGSEAVMRATSTDGIHWSKDNAFRIYGEDYGYDKKDFRDPQIFQTEDETYHMIIATRQWGKGTIVECTSKDLVTWTNPTFFMNMQWDRFYECPDVFKMGNYWYLVYNDKTQFMRMPQYFKGTSLEDLKNCTLNDAGRWPDNYREGKLDGKGIYAVKTVTNGKERLAFGWCPTRAGKDTGNVPTESEWAGNLVCHKIVQNADGTLAFAPATTDKYTKTKEAKIIGPKGAGYDIKEGNHSMFSRLMYHNLLTFDIKLSDPKGRFSIDFARGTDSEVWYSVQVNADENKANLEKKAKKAEEAKWLLDSQFKQPEDGIYHVTVCTDQSVCVVYINNELSFTNRIYNLQMKPWSITAVKGDLKIENLTFKWY